MLLRHAVKLSFIKMIFCRKCLQLVTRHIMSIFFNAQHSCVDNVILPFPPRRHVMLPKELAKRVPKTHLMSETEWRNLGVQQSQGWVHYMIHQPEPHILLFRRPLPNPKS
uniref:Cyclin-dependent kinases regulatory subunit n=1 Tax=Oreochromis niloticus TaxID=8128 RepID=A0A669D2S2_ORENI